MAGCEAMFRSFADQWVSVASVATGLGQSTVPGVPIGKKTIKKIISRPAAAI
jgi:hypothetical protein